MDLSTVFNPEDVIVDLSVTGKADLIAKLAAYAATRTGVAEDVISAALAKREKLGSTGIGHGIALPHASIAGVNEPFAALFLLKKPAEFEALDGLPVDIVFLLLAGPGGAADYLKILASVARKMHDHQVAGTLRRAKTPLEAYTILVAQDD